MRHYNIDRGARDDGARAEPGFVDIVDPTKSCPIRTLKCCLLNARSVVNKSLNVQAYLHSESLDVLAVTETFLSDAISDGELVGSGYSVYRRDRDRHGG